MNIVKKCSAIVVVIVMLFSFTTIVNADNRLSSSFPSSITAELGELFTQDGVRIYKKHYADGKAFCSKFSKLAPYTGTKCNAVAWNSNAEQNLKIGAGVAKIILEARRASHPSTPSGGTIDWDKYFYGEMAINDFLYTYNGKKSENNMAALIYNWNTVKSNSIFIKMRSLAESGYNNYGKASLDLSGAKINVTYADDETTITAATATVNAVCKDPDGNKVKCNLSEKKLKYGGQNYDLTVSSATNDKTVLTADIKSIFDSVEPNTKVTVSFSAKGTYNYPVAQQYDCGSSYQWLVPNFVVNIPDEMTDTASASYTTRNEVKCNLQLNKVDGATNTPLNGAKFDLYEVEGETRTKIGRYTVNGTAEINDLSKTSTYSLVEVKAPSGYELDSTPISITFTDENCASLSKTITNTKLTGNLTINKVDENGENVAGAKLKMYRIKKKSGAAVDPVYDDEGNVIDEDTYEYEYVTFDGNDYFITTSEPKVVTNLTIGQTYYVVEESVPEGTDYAFKKNLDSVTIKAGNNTVQLENNHSTFKVSKQSIAGSEELEGAKLEIFYENGTSTGWSWVSTDKPQEIIGLADGDYILTETTAPNGYEKAESIHFTIENGKLKDDEDNILVMKDAEIVDVPDTFTASNAITMIVGLLLVTGGSVALAYEYKKRKTA